MSEQEKSAGSKSASSAKTHRVLIIEDDKDLRELLTLLVRSKFSVDVVETDTVDGAINILKSGKDLLCVIADYNLGTEVSYDIYSFMQTNKMTMPFILCTGTTPEERRFTASDKLSAIIQKPFRSNEFIKTVDEVLRPLMSKSGEEVRGDYSPIPLPVLLRVGSLNCDIFIKLSETRFVKCENTGVSFSQEDYDRYSKKNIENLYVKSSDLEKFLDKVTTDVGALSAAKSLDSTDALKITSQAHEFLHQVVSKFGANDKAVELANSCVKLALTSILSEPGLKGYFDKLKFDKNNFLSTHSILLAQIACLLASKFGWVSEITQFKLAFAAMLHDITLPNPAVTHEELNITHCNKQNWGQIYAHPTEAVELMRKMKNLPSNVDLIVERHHERPDKSGFPHHLGALELDPLSSVFIIAHDITVYYWLFTDTFDLKKFILNSAAEYTDGTFRSVVELFEKSG